MVRTVKPWPARSLLRALHVHQLAGTRPGPARPPTNGQHRAVPTDARDRRLSGLHRLLLWTGGAGVRIRGEKSTLFLVAVFA